MGVVYEAWDPLLERTVALKTIDLGASASLEELAGYQQRFFAEARIAARLSHPGIVVVHDVGQDASGTLYIALEHLHGQTLGEILSAGPPLPWTEALRIVRRLAEALDYAHRQGVLHRDVKPANVMLLPSGEPKIMDFGIAKTETARIQLTIAGQSLGTPLYTSPEQALGQPADRRSDLFSLGAIAYSLLTGRAAFADATLTGVVTRVVQLEPPPPSSLVAGLPAEVDAVVARALAKRPQDRYQDGSSLAEDIGDVLEGRTPRHCSRPAAAAAAAALDSDLDQQFAALVAPLEAPLSPAAGSAPSVRSARHTGSRRRLVFLGLGVLAMALAALLLWPRQKGGRGESSGAAGLLPPADAAWLVVELERPAPAGGIRVWVDRALVADEQWSDGPESSSHIVRFTPQPRQDTATVGERLALTPGGHDVEVQLVRDGKPTRERLWGDFQPGATRRLRARAGGLLRRKLSLDWD